MPQQYSWGDYKHYHLQKPAVFQKIVFVTEIHWLICLIPTKIDFWVVLFTRSQERGTIQDEDFSSFSGK